MCLNSIFNLKGKICNDRRYHRDFVRGKRNRAKLFAVFKIFVALNRHNVSFTCLKSYVRLALASVSIKIKCSAADDCGYYSVRSTLGSLKADVTKHRFLKTVLCYLVNARHNSVVSLARVVVKLKGVVAAKSDGCKRGSFGLIGIYVCKARINHRCFGFVAVIITNNADCLQGVITCGKAFWNAYGDIYTVRRNCRGVVFT